MYISNRKTLTIGIPAHNEEKNIGLLLKTIIEQNCDIFVLKKIIVACDGCSDKTAAIVENLARQKKVIQVINDGKRLGKNSRLNNFYRCIDTDVFLSFDADIKISDRNLLNKVIYAFSDNKVGLVGGRVVPVFQKNLVGKAVAVYEDFWSRVIRSINKGNNVHSHTGPISAGKRDFLKNVIIPNDLPDDHYLYFSAHKAGFKYNYAKNATVYIKVPTTFDDYMKQSTRFIDSGEEIRKYFGKWTEKHYYIPYYKKARAYLLTFLKHPVYLLIAIILVLLQKMLRNRYSRKNINGLWTPIASSK